jgi:hypothetical protein
MKLVINRCYGGFDISPAALRRGQELSQEACWQEATISSALGRQHVCISVLRDNKTLIQVVEELGDKANGSYGKLKIVEIPDGIEWEIHDYDGMETIHEAHRCWR